MEKINNGNATNIWHGISHNHLIRRCAQAMADEAAAMSTAASLMMAGECTADEWHAAERALKAVEQRLREAWEAEHGQPRLNRHGQYHGGQHPALVLDKHTTEAPYLDLDKLPENFRNNWIIYCSVRSSAQARFAQGIANEKVGKNGPEAEWVKVFDEAAREWLAVNPGDPMWSTGRWPEGASTYLGKAALEEAEKILGLR